MVATLMRCGPILVRMISSADPEAGHAWLGDLELGLADAVAVADADFVIGQALDGEVLSEVAAFEVCRAR